MIKDLVRIRCCKVLSGVELPMVNYHAGSPMLPMSGREISSYLHASGSRTPLTWIFPCCFFFVASLWRVF